MALRERQHAHHHRLPTPLRSKIPPVFLTGGGRGDWADAPFTVGGGGGAISVGLVDEEGEAAPPLAVYTGILASRSYPGSVCASGFPAKACAGPVGRRVRGMADEDEGADGGAPPKE